MEAVHVRDASLRLYNNCTHLKKPSEIIRHLEDEFSKEYVVLHGKSGRWDELVDSCKFYEQQLRMVDAASMRQVEQQILCPYCGKKGHAKKDCWKWQRERGVKGDSKGKSKSDGKGKDGGKHSAGKGNEKGKHKGDGKGKDDGKERKRSSRRTSAIEADRQVAMEAM